MLITRTSPLTRKTNTLNIDVTEEQLTNWQSGMLIQDAMPNLTPDEREFIMSGMTSQDWEHLYGRDDNDSEGQ